MDEGHDRRLWKVEGKAETKILGQERAGGSRSSGVAAMPGQQTRAGGREILGTGCLPLSLTSSIVI